jgi:hypothetical protein
VTVADKAIKVSVFFIGNMDFSFELLCLGDQVIDELSWVAGN